MAYWILLDFLLFVNLRQKLPALLQKIVKTYGYNVKKKNNNKNIKVQVFLQ